VKKIINESADFAHIDVMDGKFVENTTFSSETVKALEVRVPKDIHLMVEEPEKLWESYVDDNTAMVSFHIEVCKNPSALLKKIKDKGIKAGLVLNPETPVSKVKDYLDEVDYVLVMSVHPGAAGQGFVPGVLDKVKEIKKLCPDMDIEIDGGINFETAPKAVDAGATILVASSFIFEHEDPILAVDILRNI